MAATVIGAVAILAVAAWAAAAADPGICNMSTDGFDACRPAVTGLSPSEPTAACCAALGAADLRCLCSYRSSPLLPSFGIDPDLALKLPAKCSLSPPPDC